MKVVTLIPARGGSKGIPKKAIGPIAGKPLIGYAIEAALQTETNEVWVSTDDVGIKDKVKLWSGVSVLNRPEELAQDETPTEPVMLHFAKAVGFDVVVLLQCTSPLVRPRDIDLGIRAVVSGDYDSAFSVTTARQFIWKGHKKVYPLSYTLGKRPRRQDIKPEQVYRVETGAFYVTTREALLSSGLRISGWIKAIEVPYWTSFEIDEPEDLVNIEKLLTHRDFRK